MIAKFNVIDKDFQDDARRAFRQDGAVILTNLESLKEELGSSSWGSFCSDVVPRLLFSDGELLLKNHTASAVHAEQDGLPELKGKALLPHTDGYVWGDRYPDIVFLVCEECDANGGGSNYLIDGHEVIEQLDETTVRVLQNALVDHTEKRSSGSGSSDDDGVGMAQGVTAINPVIQYSKNDGSLMWRRMVPATLVLSCDDHHNGTIDDVAQDDDSDSVYASLWQPAVAITTEENGPCSRNSDDDPASSSTVVRTALRAIDKVINRQGRTAARFQLERGEVLVVNNYRMLHAREAFAIDGTRRTWRIWAWTGHSNGLPPHVQDDAGGAPATLRSAETFIRTKQRQQQ